MDGLGQHFTHHVQCTSKHAVLYVGAKNAMSKQAGDLSVILGDSFSRVNVKYLTLFSSTSALSFFSTDCLAAQAELPRM